MRQPPQRINGIRQAFDEGRAAIGMQNFSGNAHLLEILGLAGFDFVMIDTEHTAFDAELAERLVYVAEATGITALIRVAENDSTMIRKSLETGAQGVIVPRIGSAREMAAAVASVRYPPAGVRGVCNSTRAARFALSGWDEFLEWTNREVMIIPILETPSAIENAAEILSVEGVDTVLFGPGDLALNLGVLGTGLSDPRVRAAFDQVLRLCRAMGKHLMTVPFPEISLEAAEALIGQGVDAMLYSIDELLFHRLCRQIIDRLGSVPLRGGGPA